jgi:CubicO group peptidase (beta-lactamase class C family)
MRSPSPRRLRLLSLVSGVLACCTMNAGRECGIPATASRAAAANSLAAKLDPYIDSIARAGRSGSILVGQSGQILYSRGFGYADRQRCVPNTSETLFDVGSIAKTFTAVAIAQMESKGLLRSSDSLGHFFAAAPVDKRAITIRQLLTHSAGLQSNHDTAGDFQVMDRGEAVRNIMADSLLFPPGTKEKYSNSGYTLLAIIAEKASGLPFGEYLRLEIFEPAGLKSTRLWGDTTRSPFPVAKGYVGSQLKGDPSRWPLTWASAGGAGITASATDLFTFSNAIASGALIPRDADRQMWIPLVKKWAEGWEVSATPYGRLVMKGGASSYGTTAQLRRYVDRDVTIIMLFNSATTDEDFPHAEVTPRVADLVFSALK